MPLLKDLDSSLTFNAYLIIDLRQMKVIKNKFGSNKEITPVIKKDILYLIKE